MTLTELRYVVALAEECHFGRAAALCHVSQPTLSLAIKKLEQSLGVALFERTRRGPGLTPLGVQVVVRARELLAQAAGIEDLVRADRNALSGPLTLGVLPSIAPYLLPQCIPLLQKNAPDMPLSVYEAEASELGRRLRGGELDVVLATRSFQMADIVSQPLFDEPLVALLPARHRLTEKTLLERHDLQPDEVLLMAEGDEFRDEVLAAFAHLTEPTAGFSVRARVQTSTLESLRHMVASGLGIAVVPLAAAQTVVYTNDIVVSRPFVGPEPRRTLTLAWRVSFPRHKAIDLLKGALMACSALCWHSGPDAQTPASLLVDNKEW